MLYGSRNAECSKPGEPSDMLALPAFSIQARVSRLGGQD